MTSSDADVERVRRACLELEGTTEKLAWGEPTFRAKGRLYAMYARGETHHGAGRNAVWCYAPPGAQQQLVAAAPERIFMPPYVGKSGWIGLWLDAVSDDELAVHLYQAYDAMGSQGGASNSRRRRKSDKI